MLPILQIGPLSLQTPGLVLLLALWLGLGQSERYAKRSGQDASQIYNLVLVMLIAGIVGARLAYAGRNLPAFAENPVGMLAPYPLMLDAGGGLAAAALAGLVYGQRKKMALWPTLDALTPALAVLAIGVGLAHLASGDAFGAPTGLPWGIELWGEKRYPSQIFEIAAAVLIAYLVWPRKTQLDGKIAPGLRFLTFTALTAFARLFLEAFRGDSTFLVGPVRIAQAAAWIVLASTLWIIGKKRREHGSNLD